MGTRHLVLGECTDYLTGETLVDTHDERYRQALARRLVEDCGFDRGEIRPRCTVAVRAGEKGGQVGIDFTVTFAGSVAMVVWYRPGSLVTRHRPALAAARLLTGGHVPVVVVTNGREADILDGRRGRVLANGLAAIPDRAALAGRMEANPPEPIDARRLEMEGRILCAYEIDGSCACDNPEYCIRM